MQDLTLPRNIPGLNVQSPWAEMIVSGRKTVETRFYPLPLHYVGESLAIIATPGRKSKQRSHIVGIVIFDKSFLYADARAFYLDRHRHLITPETELFGWDSGCGKNKWGWPVIAASTYQQEMPRNFKKGILFTRRVLLLESISIPKLKS